MESQTRHELAEVLHADRLYLYELTHKIFSGVPSAELLELAASEQTAASVELLSREEDDLHRAAGYLRRLDGRRKEEGFFERVKSEYMKLLEGPGRLLAYPWASTFLGKEKTLFQACTLEVRDFYRRYGMLPAQYPKVADDHISLELHFMARLSRRAQEAFQTGDRERLDGCLDGQRDFLKGHMLRWVPEYADRLSQAESRLFYPQAAALVSAFLRADLELLECGALGADP